MNNKLFTVIIYILLVACQHSKVAENLERKTVDDQSVVKLRHLLEQGKDYDGEAALEFGYQLNQIKSQIGQVRFESELNKMSEDNKENYQSWMDTASWNNSMNKYE